MIDLSVYTPLVHFCSIVTTEKRERGRCLEALGFNFVGKFNRGTEEDVRRRVQPELVSISFFQANLYTSSVSTNRSKLSIIPLLVDPSPPPTTTTNTDVVANRPPLSETVFFLSLPTLDCELPRPSIPSMEQSRPSCAPSSRLVGVLLEGKTRREEEEEGARQRRERKRQGEQ